MAFCYTKPSRSPSFSCSPQEAADDMMSMLESMAPSKRPKEDKRNRSRSRSRSRSRERKKKRKKHRRRSSSSSRSRSRSRFDNVYPDQIDREIPLMMPAKFSDFFTTFPLVAFGNDLKYQIHATSLTMYAFP